MLRHLRLARARGSLTAPNSQVQDMALDILLVLEDTRDREETVERVKMLLSNRLTDREMVVDLWPEIFPTDPFAQAYDEETGEFDINKVDDSKVAWDAPANASEDEQISAWIAQAEQGVSLTGDELDLSKDWR